MSKWYPVPVSNLPNQYRIYQTGYIFGTDSLPTFDIIGTGSVPVLTGFYPQIPVSYRVYSVLVPTFADFRYRYFRFRYRFSTELIPTDNRSLILTHLASKSEHVYIKNI
ncbi:hypothetical protein HanPSC8_Chr01g0043841 [Helianthus annuus]|nr:hypothetical protein HanPSC8_Chr01g0043841 [Helianthus annuus]